MFKACQNLFKTLFLIEYLDLECTKYSNYGAYALVIFWLNEWVISRCWAPTPLPHPARGSGHTAHVPLRFGTQGREAGSGSRVIALVHAGHHHGSAENIHFLQTFSGTYKTWHMVSVSCPYDPISISKKYISHIEGVCLQLCIKEFGKKS